MLDKNSLLRHLDNSYDEAVVVRVRASLEDKNTRLIGERVSKVSVAEALRLWSTRLKNVDLTGQQLAGAEDFIARLGPMTRQRKLIQYAFIGRHEGGNLFFDNTGSHALVGAIVFSLSKAPKAE